MKIEVFDVAAERGGALTILRGFYEAAAQAKEHQWIFHVSKPVFPDTENISILHHAWVKKSWLHRLYFEAIAHRHVRRNTPDIVVSLQNVGIWRSNVDQVLYVHQSLPYSDYRFRLRAEPALWAYQNLISVLIHRSIVNARLTIVQTQWMKRIIVGRLQVDPDRIRVIHPECMIAQTRRPYELSGPVRHRFFYPSSFKPYKNHALIVDACRLLYDKGIRDFQVELTVDHEILDALRGTQLDCISTSGELTFEEVQRTYSRSVLLYPSNLESYALPLAEARRAGAMILAADTPFAHEILEGYPNVRFFAADDALSLARLMESILDGSMEYVRPFEESQEGLELPFEAINAIVSIATHTERASRVRPARSHRVRPLVDADPSQPTSGRSEKWRR